MLTYRVDGTGPTVVLLNGGLMTIVGWDVIVAALGPRFQVVRCDFRGQLLSAGPFPTSLQEHAGDVLELLDFLRISSAHVVGTSFGAEVAMVLAALAPERVESLTVIAATERATDEMRQDARQSRALAEAAARGELGRAGEVLRRIATNSFSDGWLRKQPKDFLESRERRASSLPREFFEGASAILSIVEQLDLTATLPGIEARALVIAADQDRVFPLQHSIALERLIPNARLEVIDDCGHAAVVERPAQVVELLLENLGS